MSACGPIDLVGVGRRVDVAVIVAGEERIRAIEGNEMIRPVDLVAVDFDAATGQEILQTNPMVMDLGEPSAEARLG